MVKACVSLFNALRGVVALPLIALGWFFLWSGAWIQPSAMLRRNIWSSMFFFSLQCREDPVE